MASSTTARRRRALRTTTNLQKVAQDANTIAQLMNTIYDHDWIAREWATRELLWSLLQASSNPPPTSPG